MEYLCQKINEFICWLLNQHVPQARMKLENGYMVSYYDCERCGKELE